MGIHTLELAHRFLRAQVKPGACCIDATAGRGGDTALLCELAGPEGHVLAFDIQPEAVESTRALLAQRGHTNAEVLLESHANLSRYAKPGTVDAVVFNFGWLPGGNHTIFTQPETSLEAVAQGLALLRPGGVMSLCIYYGRNNGYEERDALLEYLAAVDDKQYNIVLCSFPNRKNDPPIAALILREDTVCPKQKGGQTMV